mmetsp:Transcript_30089/g.65653  ORF Transcript_30089/g.65653 Transcript_30089/m.65653 type:complete len:235 (+) Transcript_30089:129-833(+)
MEKCSPKFVDGVFELCRRQIEHTGGHGHHCEGSTDDGEDGGDEVVPPPVTLSNDHLHGREIVGKLGLRNHLALNGSQAPLVCELVASEAASLPAGVHHLDVVVRRHVKLGCGEDLAVEWICVPFVLAGQRRDGTVGILAEGEAVYVVRDIGEGEVERLVIRVHRLEVHRARHSSYLHESRDATALGEHLVVLRSSVHVALTHFSVGKLRQGFHLPRSAVLHPLLVFRSASIESN